MWISQNEGSKLWLNMLTELNNRGLKEAMPIRDWQISYQQMLIKFGKT